MTEVESTDRRVVVIGGGHAGVMLVALLRQGGHRGEIVLLGDELNHPYERPPLSKEFDGEVEQLLRPPEFYAEQDVTLQLGERVTSLDPNSRRVSCESGRSEPYDVAVLATGARPRTLAVPGVDLSGVIALRALADARVLRKWLVEKRRLVIVGAGYIGLEVAAVAAANGVEVTVLEREDRVLSRVASEELSSILTAAHGAQSIDIHPGTQVSALRGSDGAVREVLLASGKSLPADGVLVGIGADPCDELARDAGLDCEGGVIVDSGAQTSDPAILATGDATSRPVPGLAGRMRLESIPSATEQARQAVATILGTDPPEPETPWFWSDQFDLKLKIAGVVQPGREVALRGDPENRKFALFHHDAGRVTAVEASNSAAEFMAGKKLIARGNRIEPGRLEDPATMLRDLVKD